MSHNRNADWNLELNENFVRTRSYTQVSRRTRPTVLYITNKFRRLPDSGGATREYELLCRLVDHFDINYVAVTESFEEEVGFLDSPILPFSSVTLIRVEYLQKKHSPRRIVDHSSRYASAAIQKIANLISPTIIHVVGYFLMGYLPTGVSIPIVLQEENIEYQLARDEDLVRRDEHVVLEINYGEALERAAWRKADICLTVAEEDSAIIKQEVAHDKVICLPNGITKRKPISRVVGSGRTSPRALFVGNYNWPPSWDAAYTIISDIWPRVRKEVPDAKVDLAGAGMDTELIQLAKNTAGVTAIGRYSTFESLVENNTVFLCPLRFGGGIKNKILDALGAGLPIVATSLSLRGFNDEVRSAVSTQDDIDDFVGICVQLFQQQEFRSYLSQRSQNVAKVLPSWSDTANVLGNIWNSVSAQSILPMNAHSVVSSLNSEH